jgi:hypothetical protein
VPEDLTTDQNLDIFETLCSFNKRVMTDECESDLPDMIHTHLKTKPSDDRDGLHVSDFSDPCLRRLMYKVMKPEIRDPKPDAESQKLFAAGHAIHEWHQNNFLGPMGILKGEWLCRGCGKLVKGYMPKEACGCHSWAFWDYQELGVSTKIAGLDIVGHTDGIITLRGTDRVLEMKSKDSDLFKSLAKPEPKHIVQGSIYAALLGVKYLTVLYIEKNKWQYKAYTAEAAQWALEWFVSSVTSLAKLLEMKDPMRVSPKCNNKNVVRAKRCALRATCFPK